MLMVLVQNRAVTAELLLCLLCANGRAERYCCTCVLAGNRQGLKGLTFTAKLKKAMGDRRQSRFGGLRRC